ncbi:hypothetical protein FGG08_000367 [Glutinoglossum americanum]|uniref:Uncharacterized protein n=1 Tax=Glutinoglossum americanum TaxID=1670608 RepID=A0A9P8I3Y7_9PEZI|nr:hypothetical protein FGG08_000367 [Glutinoglossum americanum]
MVAKLIGGTNCANALPADGGAAGGDGREGGGDGEYPFTIVVPFVNNTGEPLGEDELGGDMPFEDDPFDASGDSFDIDGARTKIKRPGAAIYIRAMAGSAALGRIASDARVYRTR